MASGHVADLDHIKSSWADNSFAPKILRPWSDTILDGHGSSVDHAHRREEINGVWEPLSKGDRKTAIGRAGNLIAALWANGCPGQERFCIRV